MTDEPKDGLKALLKSGRDLLVDVMIATMAHKADMESNPNHSKECKHCRSMAKLHRAEKRVGLA